MQIDKQEIINMLRERGDHAKADQAEKELPDQVDHEQHSDKLQQFGLNPQELMSKISSKF